MDEVLHLCEEKLFTPYVYPKDWRSEDDLVRQTVSLLILSFFGSYLVYLIPATLSYVFLFDKRLREHKKFLPNQEWLELKQACGAVPLMVILTVPFFLLEIRGHTKLYDSIYERSFTETALLYLGFLCWNDCLVYWTHRALHHPVLYKRLHKPHHKWLVPTPFASHAFHPLDGYLQGLPYHLYVLVFPLPKWLYLASFILVNFWTISIHDELFMVPDRFNLREIINCAAHHTDHHLFFNYNHGLYFTLWDRIGGTYRKPSHFLHNGVYDDLHISKYWQETHLTEKQQQNDTKQNNGNNKKTK